MQKCQFSRALLLYGMVLKVDEKQCSGTEFLIIQTLKLRMASCTNEPGHEKMCLMPYANNKGADQPAHPRSLISASVSLPRQNDTSSLYIRNFKIPAGLCSRAGQFVSRLVGDSRRHIVSWRGSFNSMYKQYKEREAKEDSFFTVDCHQTIINKANKKLKTNRKLMNNDN